MSDAATDGRRMLVVRSRQRRWAVPVDRVVHVGAMERMARLPNAPPGLIGVTAFFGDIVPVHDLAAVLPVSPDDDARMCGTDGDGMLLLVLRAGRVIGLKVDEINDIRPSIEAEAELLGLDSLVFPDPPEVRGVPGAAPDRKATMVEEADTLQSAVRLLAVVLAGQTLFLPLADIVEVMDRADTIPVPWADPCVPEILVRGGVVLPVVRLDLLLQARPAAARDGVDLPLLVVRRMVGLVAFRVDRVAGLVARAADRVALDIDALLAGLPGAQDAVTAAGRGTTAVDQAGTGSDGRAYLSFLLADQVCLLPMAVVRSIADHTRPAALPETRGDDAGALSGLRAIDGQILPVIDARRSLGLSRDTAATADIVVAAAGLASFVVPARSIDGIVRLADSAVHKTGWNAAIGGVVQLSEGPAWLLDAVALAGGASPALSGPQKMVPGKQVPVLRGGA